MDMDNNKADKLVAVGEGKRALTVDHLPEPAH